MPAHATGSVLTLDSATLLLLAMCLATVLGLFLLVAWTKERTSALLWWGAAYLVGGASVALWNIDAHRSGFMPPSLPNVMLLFACGMMWGGARLFHGRRVRWRWLGFGSMIWLVAGLVPSISDDHANRVVLSAVIIASYTSLTAFEFWRERRRSLLRRGLALAIPALHGTVFLLPIALANVLPEASTMTSLVSGWIAIFALETLLYAVGAAFVMLTVSNDRAVLYHKTAASTDALTGLFNRRAFYEGVERLTAQRAKRNLPVTMVLFDVDFFKQVNDRFGHAIGDETLKAFAATVTANVRAGDLVGRFGGDEFAAAFAETLANSANAAERVRAAFEIAAQDVLGHRTGASVSVGVASGATLKELLERADAVLYRAKAAGRNCVEAEEIGMVTPGRVSAPSEASAAA